MRSILVRLGLMAALLSVPSAAPALDPPRRAAAVIEDDLAAAVERARQEALKIKPANPGSERPQPPPARPPQPAVRGGPCRPDQISLLGVCADTPRP